MLLRPLLSFCCWLLLTGLTAQTNWRAGTITTVDGRTRNVDIDDRRWGFHFDRIRIRAGDGGTVTRLPVSELASFAVSNRRYVIRRITVNLAPRVINELVRREDAPRETLLAPLLVLQAGDPGLYEYNDRASNNHFFLGDAAGRLLPLRFGRYARGEVNSYIRYVTDNGFRRQLARTFADCPSVRDRTRKLRYDRRSLLRLFDLYSNCKLTVPTYRFANDPNVLSFGLDLGAVRTNPRLSDLDFGDAPRPDLIRFTPLLGLSASYRFAGAEGAVALRAAALYHQYRREGTGEVSISPPLFREFREVLLEERALQFQFGPQVTIVRTRYPIFVEPYVEFHYLLRYTDLRGTRRVFPNQEEVVEGDLTSRDGTGRLGLSLGVGVRAGDLTLSVRGGVSRGDYGPTGLTIYRLGALASYRLF